METFVKLLEDIGLTPSQSQVYLSLLEIGESTTGPIIEKSKLHNSVVYNALNQLVEKGLVSFVIKGKTKYFLAANPKSLVAFIDDKRKSLLDALPLLTQKLDSEKRGATVFSGWKGVYSAFNAIIDELPRGSEYIGFAAGIGTQFSKETKEFFEIYNGKRSEMNYNVKLIANESERNIVKKYRYEKNQKKPSYRFVDDISFEGIIIFGDKILQVAFGKDPVAVIISSKLMAESFRKTFYSFWKIAKT